MELQSYEQHVNEVRARNFSCLRRRKETSAAGVVGEAWHTIAWAPCHKSRSAAQSFPSSFTFSDIHPALPSGVPASGPFSKASCLACPGNATESVRTLLCSTYAWRGVCLPGSYFEPLGGRGHGLFIFVSLTPSTELDT